MCLIQHNGAAPEGFSVCRVTTWNMGLLRSFFFFSGFCLVVGMRYLWETDLYISSYSTGYFGKQFTKSSIALGHNDCVSDGILAWNLPVIGSAPRPRCSFKPLATHWQGQTESGIMGNWLCVGCPNASVHSNGILQLENAGLYSHGHGTVSPVLSLVDNTGPILIPS